VRVVADSHAIYWYVVSPDRLSPRALDVLAEAEATDGIAVSAVTMPDLWMAATRKRGDRAVPHSGYELLRATLLDPSTALDVAPLDATTWQHFEALPRSIADPMDGLIVATALALELPLVSRDSRITEAGVVEVLW
jgi:PIN domain nuclease of toxin-antitoxin system